MSEFVKERENLICQMKKNRGKFVSLLINAYLCNRFWDESQSVSIMGIVLDTSCHSQDI